MTQIPKLYERDKPISSIECFTIKKFVLIFMKYNPTIKDSYIIEVVVNDQQYTLKIINTAGVGEYSYFRDK